MYKLLRNILFTLPAETSHHVSLDAMLIANSLGLLGLLKAKPVKSVSALDVMGLQFPNRVGLAAGLDKSAEYIDALAALGFGFIEVGTLTPRPQPGNPRPRLFRLRQHEAIINRMGFNNKGIDYALGKIQRSNFRGVLGINIGKNFDTPIEKAVDDYLHGLRRCYTAASYVAVNLSSPNTPGLRELQFGEHLKRLLDALKQAQQNLTTQHGRYVPVAIKIAPDLEQSQIEDIAGALLAYKIDAVIATNTTMDREAVATHPLAGEAGGLSGKPLTGKATNVIGSLKAILADQLPIIGVGGIMTASDALEKVAAGATLLQLYTGFIYRGPRLIAEILDALEPGA